VVLAFLAHWLFVGIERAVTPWATGRGRAVG